MANDVGTAEMDKVKAKVEYKHPDFPDRLSSVYRMNRKYAGIHPGHARDYKPTLNCYIDQSGSMSDEDIILCFGELANLSHRVDIVVYHFDTEVDESSKQTWKKGLANPKARSSPSRRRPTTWW